MDLIGLILPQEMAYEINITWQLRDVASAAKPQMLHVNTFLTDIKCSDAVVRDVVVPGEANRVLVGARIAIRNWPSGQIGTLTDGQEVNTFSA